MNPLISIITPTYNHEKYISKCIESLINQTYENWEQLIIDDGSTDNTAAIVSDFNDKRIIYVKQDNLGIYNLQKTYNKALSMSSGEYIAVLEGDDYWPNYKLEEQIKIFKNQRIVLGWGNAQIVNGENEVEGFVHKSKSFPQISSTHDTLDTLLLRNQIPACTVLCRKNALSKIGGFQQPPNSPCVDYATWLNLSKLGSYYYSDSVMGYWRRHKGQASSKSAFEMLKSNIDYSLDFFNNMPNEEKKLLTVNYQKITEFKNQMLADFNFILGRKCLYKKDWRKSRDYFKKSLNGSNIVKFYSSVGILCGFLRIDFEKLVLILNKKHINDFK